MHRNLVAFALISSLLQFLYSFFPHSTAKAGAGWDPSGLVKPNVGAGWDPNGSASPNAGAEWDPNG